jgi:hypothetical protein
MTEFVFPTPLANDPDDVVIALKSARSIGDAQDLPEAARWIRKAAAAAEESGNDRRARELSKKASDLESAGQRDQVDPPSIQAIRVAVRRSVRDGDLFVARMVDSQPIPPGSHEAFLVLTTPNLDLFDSTTN